jgi:hypothetical protein
MGSNSGQGGSVEPSDAADTGSSDTSTAAADAQTDQPRNEGGIGGSAAATADGFETGSFGSIWTIVGQDGTGRTPTTAVIDGQNVHGGKFAAHITSGYIEVTPPAAAFYARAWVYFASDPGTNHWANAIGATADDSQEIRYGGRTGILEINIKSNDNEILADPLISYCATTPCPASDPRIPVGAWTCVEYYFGVNSMAMWLNGTEIVEFAVSPTTMWAHGGTLTSPAYAKLGFGYAAYGAAATNVWYDDVAVDANRIGCN